MVDWGKAPVTSTRDYSPSGRSQSSPYYKGGGQTARQTRARATARDKARIKANTTTVEPFEVTPHPKSTAELQGTANPFQAAPAQETPAGVQAPRPVIDRGLLGDIGLGGFRDTITSSIRDAILRDQEFTKQSLGFGEPLNEQQQLEFSTALGGGFGLGVKPVLGQTKKGLSLVKTGQIPSTAGKLRSAGDKVYNAIRSIFVKNISKTSTVITTNPVTGKVTPKTVTTITEGFRITSPAMLAVTGTLGVAWYVVSQTMGGRNFGNFIGVEESAPAAGIVVNMAAKAENYDQYLEAREIQKRAEDFDAGIIPIANVAEGIELFRGITKDAGTLMDKIQYDKEQARINGTDPDSMWILRKEEEAAMQRANTDYFNEQHLLATQRDIELKATATDEYIAKIEGMNARDRAAQKRVNEETAKFWLNYRKELHKLEAEERLRIAQFWLDYKKMVLELEKAERAASYGGGSSTLGFGLLR